LLCLTIRHYIGCAAAFPGSEFFEQDSLQAQQTIRVRYSESLLFPLTLTLILLHNECASRCQLKVGNVDIENGCK